MGDRVLRNSGNDVEVSAILDVVEDLLGVVPGLLGLGNDDVSLGRGALLFDHLDPVEVGGPEPVKRVNRVAELGDGDDVDDGRQRPAGGPLLEPAEVLWVVPCNRRRMGRRAPNPETHKPTNKKNKNNNG